MDNRRCRGNNLSALRHRLCGPLRVASANAATCNDGRKGFDLAVICQHPNGGFRRNGVGPETGRGDRYLVHTDCADASETGPKMPPYRSFVPVVKGTLTGQSGEGVGDKAIKC